MRRGGGKAREREGDGVAAGAAAAGAAAAGAVDAGAAALEL